MDPIRERGGLNVYAFVANNPTGHVDHLGMKWIWESDLDLDDDDLGPEYWEYTHYGIVLNWTCKTSVSRCCSATEGWVTVPIRASESDGWTWHYREEDEAVEFPDSDLIIPAYYWPKPDHTRYLKELSDSLFWKAYDRAEELAGIARREAEFLGCFLRPESPIECEGDFRWHGVLPNGDYMMFDRNGSLDPPPLAYENTY